MYLSDITVTDICQIILPTTWRQKPTGIDMERNYVTVTLYVYWYISPDIGLLASRDDLQLRKL